MPQRPCRCTLRAIARPLFLLPLLLVSTGPAAALFVERDGVAVAVPDGGNSTVTGIAISCGDPVAFEVTARDGPVMPIAAEVEPGDYLYTPGKVLAVVDAVEIPLIAAGSGEATVLFADDPASPGGMGPLTTDFFAALSQGRELVLRFDITPGDDPETGTSHETHARFDLEGAGAVLDAVFAQCGYPTPR